MVPAHIQLNNAGRVMVSILEVVIILELFTDDDTFTFVACVHSQRKRTYVLPDTHIKRLCFLGVPEV